MLLALGFEPSNQYWHGVHLYWHVRDLCRWIFPSQFNATDLPFHKANKNSKLQMHCSTLNLYHSTMNVKFQYLNQSFRRVQWVRRRVSTALRRSLFALLFVSQILPHRLELLSVVLFSFYPLRYHLLVYINSIVIFFIDHLWLLLSLLPSDHRHVIANTNLAWCKLASIGNSSDFITNLLLINFFHFQKWARGCEVPITLVAFVPNASSCSRLNNVQGSGYPLGFSYLTMKFYMLFNNAAQTFRLKLRLLRLFYYIYRDESITKHQRNNKFVTNQLTLP